MTQASYPALGFDPAPGSVPAVDELRSSLARVVASLDEAYDGIAAITRTDGFWSGGAADSFTRRAGDLPKSLDQARRSLGTAARALGRWAPELEALQYRADRLEEEAAEAKRRLAAVPASPALLLEDTTFAERELDAAQDALAEILRRASELAEEHRQSAAGIERQIRNAAEQAPVKGLPDALGDRLSDAWGQAKTGPIGMWHAIDENDRVLESIGDVLGDVGAACGVVAIALAPTGIGFAAGESVALGASMGSLTAHGLAKAGGNDDVGWDTLGMDAFGVVTGGLGKASAKHLEYLQSFRRSLKANHEWQKATEVLRHPVRHWRQVSDANWWAQTGGVVVEAGKTAAQRQFRELWDDDYWMDRLTASDSDPKQRIDAHG